MGHAAVPDGGAADGAGGDRAGSPASEGGVSGTAWLSLRPSGSGRPRLLTSARTTHDQKCERFLPLPRKIAQYRFPGFPESKPIVESIRSFCRFIELITYTMKGGTYYGDYTSTLYKAVCIRS
jgi:hypothetical protein